nr:hypothetical protein [uncultured Campylobacter sp.]
MLTSRVCFAAASESKYIRGEFEVSMLAVFGCVAKFCIKFALEISVCTLNFKFQGA